MSVLKHELAHVLQHRLGRGEVGILPDGLLPPSARTPTRARGYDRPDALSQQEVNGELEARLASRYVPSGLIAFES